MIDCFECADVGQWAVVGNDRHVYAIEDSHAQAIGRAARYAGANPLDTFYVCRIIHTVQSVKRPPFIDVTTLDNTLDVDSMSF